MFAQGTFFKGFFRENIGDFTDLHNEKNSILKLRLNAVIIFHFEGMSFSSAHDLKQWDFLDNNEIFSEFAVCNMAMSGTHKSWCRFIIDLYLLSGTSSSQSHFTTFMSTVTALSSFDEDFAWQAWKSSFKMGA